MGPAILKKVNKTSFYEEVDYEYVKVFFLEEMRCDYRKLPVAYKHYCKDKWFKSMKKLYEEDWNTFVRFLLML